VIVLLLALSCSEPTSTLKPKRIEENFLSCWPELSQAPIPVTLQENLSDDLLFVLHPPSKRLIVYSNRKIILRDNTLFCFHIEQTESIQTGIEGIGEITVDSTSVKITMADHKQQIYSTENADQSSQNPLIQHSHLLLLRELLEQPYPIILLR